MDLIAAPAPACLIVDTNQKLTLLQIVALSQATWQGRPIGGIGRYVSLNKPNLAYDIDATELQNICGVRPGFGCILVQHVRYGVGSKQSPKGWTPSQQLGQMDGLVARRHGALVGYPGDASLALDLEGVNPTTPHTVVTQHCNAWASSVTGPDAAPAYRGLLYDGYSPDLTPQELWQLPDFHAYWGTPGAQTIPNRGFVMVQRWLDVVVAGVKVDVSEVAAADAMGGQLMWAIAA